MISKADLMSQDDFWDAMKHDDWEERVAAIWMRLDEQQRRGNRYNRPAVCGRDIFYDRGAE